MLLPNPFDFVEVVMPSASKAAAPMPIAPAEGAAAIDLMDEPSRFVLDVDAFMNDLEPLPAFLIDPRPQYLQAAEIIPVLRALACDNF